MCGFEVCVLRWVSHTVFCHGLTLASFLDHLKLKLPRRFAIIWRRHLRPISRTRVRDRDLGLRPIAVHWVALDSDLRRWLGMELRISRMLAYRMLHSGASAFGQRPHCTACGTVWLRPLCSAGADLRGQVQRRGVVFDLAPRMQPPAEPRAAAPFAQFSAARGPLSVVRRLRSSGNPPGHLACACG